VCVCVCVCVSVCLSVSVRACVCVCVWGGGYDPVFVPSVSVLEVLVLVLGVMRCIMPVSCTPSATTTFTTNTHNNQQSHTLVVARTGTSHQAKRGSDGKARHVVLLPWR
jgi:hypothetical protein